MRHGSAGWDGAVRKMYDYLQDGEKWAQARQEGCKKEVQELKSWRLWCGVIFNEWDAKKVAQSSKAD